MAQLVGNDFYTVFAKHTNTAVRGAQVNANRKVQVGSWTEVKRKKEKREKKNLVTQQLQKQLLRKEQEQSS